jgi:hypothetical protein
LTQSKLKGENVALGEQKLNSAQTTVAHNAANVSVMEYPTEWFGSASVVGETRIAELDVAALSPF